MIFFLFEHPGSNWTNLVESSIQNKNPWYGSALKLEIFPISPLFKATQFQSEKILTLLKSVNTQNSVQMQPKFSQNVANIQSKFSQNVAKMQSKCSQNAVKM